MLDCVDDEDEVLLALAEELGNFVEFVGGPEHASVLLSPLEVLSTVEETTVRDKSVDSLNKIAEAIPVEQVKDTFVNLIRRLASGDWFTSRTSACGLFAVTYTKVTDDIKKELRGYFCVFLDCCLIRYILDYMYNYVKMILLWSVVLLLLILVYVIFIFAILLFSRHFFFVFHFSSFFLSFTKILLI